MRRVRNVTAIALILASACVSVALAAGSAPTPPSVSTGSASNPTETGATLTGAVNPNGQQTDYAFQWGPTDGYGRETPLASAGAGTSWQSVAATLSGLSPGTKYHFRIIALTSDGDTVVGSDSSFTTTGTAPAPSTPPVAETTAASNVAPTTATVSGTANPEGQGTTYYFEYGLTGNYGMQTAPASAGSGKADEQVSANLDKLMPGATYHYRLVAVSAGGTTLGKDQTLTTTATPMVTTGTASGISTGSATVNGTVNPDGKATTYYFQYGTTTSYGTNVTSGSAGSGTADVAVHAYLGGLKAHTTYHYRLVATNADGTTYGSDASFTTQSTSVPPATSNSQVRVMGRMGFVSPGRVIGVEVGCFDGTTRCSGHVTMTHDGQTIGQRDYSIAPNSGGFQNLEITGAGEQMLHSYNRVFHLLPVTITVSPSGGKQFSYVMHLARWVWR